MNGLEINEERKSKIQRILSLIKSLARGKKKIIRNDCLLIIQQYRSRTRTILIQEKKSDVLPINVASQVNAPGRKTWLAHCWQIVVILVDLLSAFILVRCWERNGCPNGWQIVCPTTLSPLQGSLSLFNSAPTILIRNLVRYLSVSTSGRNWERQAAPILRNGWQNVGLTMLSSIFSVDPFHGSLLLINAVIGLTKLKLIIMRDT